jgi:hypothetical protein
VLGKTGENRDRKTGTGTVFLRIAFGVLLITISFQTSTIGESELMLNGVRRGGVRGNAVFEIEGVFAAAAGCDYHPAREIGGPRDAHIAKKRCCNTGRRFIFRWRRSMETFSLTVRYSNQVFIP